MIDLSVHLITYNSEKYIEETLDSILKQECSFNYEIVVGDDCSTDKTLEIIFSYQKKHPQIFNIKKNNTQLGIFKNFKATLDRCKGKYVFDIAGDDIIKSKKAFQKMVDLFKSNPNLSFIDSGYDKFFQNEKSTLPFSNEQSINVSKERYREFVFLGKIIPIGVCYNKRFLYKYVDFDYYINKNITIEDYPILVNLAANCNFDRINEVLYIYRIHDLSHSHKTSFKRFFFQRNQMLDLFHHFKKKYSFSEKTSETFKQSHYKAILRLASLFEKKDLGKSAYKQIKQKNSHDFIRYLASQYPLIKHLIRLRRKIF